MSNDEPRPCGKNKVLHLSEDSADIQADSLGEKHGLKPNVYKCDECTEYYGYEIWHVGYGYDAAKLRKKARRNRIQSKSHTSKTQK